MEIVDGPIGIHRYHQGSDIWVAIGGKTVLLAAFIGAMAVKSVENVLSDTLGQYWLLVLGILFVIVVVLLPRGLLAPLLQIPLPRALRLSDSHAAKSKT